MVEAERKSYVINGGVGRCGGYSLVTLLCSCLFTMLSLFPTLIFILSLPLSVLSATNSSNSNTNTCDPAHNGLASGTLQFNSDCNATTWCDGGQCRAKGCRKDRFPLGYGTDSGSRANGKQILPPELCKDTEFCPDEGSQCTPKIAVGQPCQFDRDGS